MKKIVTLCLIAAMSLQLMACAIGNKDAWIEENTGKVGSTLDCGQFVVNGEVYSFPGEIADWLSSGWHISNNYENKDTFKLESNVDSNEFELFNDEVSSQYVSMLAINLNEEPSKIADCSIEQVEINVSTDNDSVKLVLPGGITYKSTREDVIAAYGEPVLEEDGGHLYYQYTSADDWDVNVEIDIRSDAVYKVTYYLSETNWGYIGNADDCIQYVDDALKASFYGDYAHYVETKFDTEEGAQELYAAEIEYYTQGLMYYLDVDYDTIDPSIIDSYRDLAAEVLSRFKWDTPVVDLDDGADYGEVTLTMYPTDFLDIILPDAQAVADASADMTEDEYAENMLAAISPLVSEISYRDPITYTYDIDLTSGIISSDDWDEIDDILMDFAE
ncbi:MAG: hypothetical protein NC314_11630 [Roseburia sp.]|nr:hypothetical protein [Ruminococcus sp.]MCM1156278.1 hypothetical protein [Roseburia sp.]MCM1243483.1 hypothetical protein [Roseburia sp.]